MLLKSLLKNKQYNNQSQTKPFLVIKGIAGTLIGGLILYVLLRKINPSAVAVELARVDLAQLIKALVFILLSYICRTVMWKKLLEEFYNYSYGALFRVMMIGYLVNNILPARLGDVTRGIWLYRSHGGSSGSIFGSLALERIMDVSLVTILLSISLLWLGLYRKWLIVNMAILAGVVAVFFIVGILLRQLVLCHALPHFVVAVKEWITRFTRLKNLRATLIHLSNAISINNMIRGLLWLIITWFVTYWGLYFTMASLHLTEQVGYLQTALMLCIASLGIAVPSLPASLGTYQAAFIFGGMLLEISETQALAVSFLYQGLWVGVTSALGLISLGWEMLTK